MNINLQTKKRDRMFNNFFLKYVRKIDEGILREISKIGIEIVDIYEFELLHSDIYKLLFKSSIRTMIRELHEYKEKGELFGKTSEERFNFFENYTDSIEFKKCLDNKYPVLVKIINEYVDNCIIYVTEIISNFYSCKSKLEEAFNVKLSDIKDISLGCGDTHNGGKTVAIIFFDDFKLVYKPHNMKTDYILTDIVKWINNKGNLACRLGTLKSVSFDEFGFQEYVESKECSSKEEANRFYYRMGVFLSLFYVLGTNDLHFENIIAKSEWPVFIDLETLFSNDNKSDVKTVLSTGLLPQHFLGYFIDVDCSGICGNSNKSEKMKTMIVSNPYTDEMHVDEKPVEIFRTNNIVYINKVKINIENYSEEILKGFEDLWNLIVKMDEEFIEFINSEIDADNDFFRIVLRHTQVYSKYIATALHPDFLINPKKFEELFARLRMNCTDVFEEERVEDEISTLLSLDVPYYRFKYSSGDLYSGNGLVKKNYFQKTAQNMLVNRIKRMELTKQFNKNLIQKSLFLSYTNKFQETKIDVKQILDKKLSRKEMLIEVANKVMNNSLMDEENGQALHYILSLYGDKYYLMPINYDMYEGGGIILYMIAAGKKFNIPEYIRMGLGLLNASILTEAYLQGQGIKQRLISAFSGEMSLVYLYYLIADILEDSSYIEKADKIICERLAQLEESNQFDKISYDYLGGISGVIVCLCNIRKKYNEKSILVEFINKLECILMNHLKTNKFNDIGLAHGMSGYAYALIALYKNFNKAEYIKMAEELLLKEDQHVNILENNVNSSWCKGLSGLCLARHIFLKSKSNKNIENSLKKYLKLITNIKNTKCNNMSLCHGNAGVHEIVNEINIGNNDSKKRKNVDISGVDTNIYKPVYFSRVEDIQLEYTNNFQTDNFMTGLSGIAYSELRVIYNDLPSILFLEY